MTEDAIFKEQWNLLKKEMAMGDAHLQQRLEQFIFRQYGRAVLTHYIKALSVQEEPCRNGTHSLLDRACGNNHPHDAGGSKRHAPLHLPAGTCRRNLPA